MNTRTGEVESSGHFAPMVACVGRSLFVVQPKRPRNIQSYANAVYRKKVTRHQRHDPIRVEGG
jgi:hypothetical protein